MTSSSSAFPAQRSPTPLDCCCVAPVPSRLTIGRTWDISAVSTLCISHNMDSDCVVSNMSCCVGYTLVSVCNNEALLRCLTISEWMNVLAVSSLSRMPMFRHTAEPWYFCLVEPSSHVRRSPGQGDTHTHTQKRSPDAVRRPTISWIDNRLSPSPALVSYCLKEKQNRKIKIRDKHTRKRRPRQNHMNNNITHTHTHTQETVILWNAVEFPRILNESPSRIKSFSLLTRMNRTENFYFGTIFVNINKFG